MANKQDKDMLDEYDFSNGIKGKYALHPQAQNITCTDAAIIVELLDGRTISAPFVWFPRLSQATKEQLDNWELLGDGEGIHWPDVDEDLSVAGLLAGTH